MAWDLSLGQEDSRTGIQSRFGGSNARGISAPAAGGTNSDIMLWWKPEHGSTYGYEDGWTRDHSSFYFTGTGQFGDQQFGPPFGENGRLRDHLANGDHVRLLRYVRKNWTRYVAELRLHPTDPWRWIDGPDGTMATRRMIQFRFVAVDALPPATDEITREPILSEVVEVALRLAPPPPTPSELEALRTKEFKKFIRAREVVASRTEAILVHDFRDWLFTARGLPSSGLTIPYAPEGRNLYADLFLPSLGILVEAKASASREHLRMAIGQLLDYARFISPRPQLMCLVPDKPPQDMLELLVENDIAVAWRSSISTFELAPPDAIDAQSTVVV